MAATHGAPVLGGEVTSKTLSIPANATEAPSIAKVWQQVVVNAPTFATVWILMVVAALMETIVSGFLHLLANLVLGSLGVSPDDALAWTDILAAMGSLPIGILGSLISVLMTAIPAIYYATNHCPGPRQVLRILIRKPLRYLGAGFLFSTCGIVGFVLCIVPGVLVVLATPLYVHYIFTTDLDPITCLSKAFKGMFQDFGSFFGVSFLCGLAVAGSILLCIIPVLAVWPMTQLYMQNYIHYKGLVTAREAS